MSGAYRECRSYRGPDPNELYQATEVVSPFPSVRLVFEFDPITTAFIITASARTRARRWRRKLERQPLSSAAVLIIGAQVAGLWAALLG